MKTKILKTILCRSAAIAVLAFAMIARALSAHADEKTLWQIGKINRSYAEFAIAGNSPAYKTTFSHGVVFHIGQDDPAKSWPFIQPGPSDGIWAGEHLHPTTILFDLPDQIRGVVTLTIAFVNTHATLPPTYTIDVNGIEDAISLPHGAGDEALTDATKGKEFTLTLPFAASLLKKGENRIILASTSGSWVLYDGLCLTQNPDASLPPVTITDLRIAPTERIIRADNGKPKRVITISALFSRPMAPATVTVTTATGSQQYPVTFSSNLLAQTEAFIDTTTTQPCSVSASLTCENVTQATAAVVPPGRFWKLYILPAIHVDIGYSDYQERVAQIHVANTVHALSLFDKYPDFKWNTEAAWVEDNFLSTMPTGRKAEFIQRANEGRMGVDAVYGNMLTGISSHEGLIRNLYFAHKTAKQYGMPFDMAVSCDVPTRVGTWPSILAGSGIHYYAAGFNFYNTDAAPPMNTPFYWKGPDGGRVLTYFSPGYGFALYLGLTSSVEAAGPPIDNFLRGFARSDYQSNSVLAYGAWNDNGTLQESLPAIVAAWNKRYLSPKVVFCRGPEFFQDIKKTWKGKIPTIAGDAGTAWEDGVGSSAVETALARNGAETLLTAEKLNALTTRLGKPAAPTAAFDAAWKNSVLWDEHTWGAAGSITSPESEMTLHQWKIKAKFATDLSSQADTLLDNGLMALSKAVKVSEPSVLVYNPLSWPTSGLVTAKAPDGTSVAFHADHIPPLGYRVYPRTHLPSVPGSHATYDPQTLTLSNTFYTLQVDRATGALRSIRDNTLHRELLDPNAPYRANQYIYFGTADVEATTNFAAMQDLTQSAGAPSVTVAVEDCPAGKALVIKTSAYNTPQITSEILLHDDQKRIDFTDTLDKKETRCKEAAFFAFPFQLDRPRIHVELPDGVLRPDTGSMPGAPMEHYCLQDFVAAEDDQCAVTWTAIDTPLVTLSKPDYRNNDGHLTYNNGYVYGYVFNNLWDTNYKASQGGKMVFRFALTSTRKYDPAASARFGQTVRHPLVAVAVKPAGHRVPSRQDFSLCSVSPATVAIQAVKQAEIGQGIVIRLRELAGHASKATITLAPGLFQRAALCNLMEDAQSPLKIANGKLTVPITANSLATIRLK